MTSSTIAPTTDMMKPAACPSLVPTYRATGPGGQERSGDADEHGDDNSARILAGHDEFRHGADD
jgi:hypothetical protein